MESGLATWLRLEDPAVRDSYSFEPDQFNILSVPGYGEAAISISSNLVEPEKIRHIIRLTGNVTNAIGRLKVGDRVGIRGPFGTF